MIENFILKTQTDGVFWLLMFVAFLLIIHLVFSLNHSKKSKKQKKHDEKIAKIGKDGENAVYEILSQTKSKHKKIINDIVIKTKADKTSQIDHILINEAGIFVVETKNYKGLIYGSPDSYNWCQYLGNQKFFFYSPVMQNAAHMKRLKAVLGEEYPYYSVIVFVQNNIKKLNIDYVIDLQDLPKYINSNRKKKLKPVQIKKIYKTLMAMKKKKYKNVLWTGETVT